MELAIVAGLGLLGYKLAVKGEQPRVLQKTPRVLSANQDYPFEPQLDTAMLLDADVRNARKHVMRVYDPATGKYTFQAEKVGAPEGPVMPPQPFVRSDKTAPSSALMSQRRVELFTGFTGAEETTGAWKHKAEKTPAFAPVETHVTVGSGGTAKSSEALYDRQELVDRNVFGSRMNNVLPFEQKRVGPGLGIGAGVPSADGLHSQFRVMPTEALNAHRINQLPGRSASGAALITSAGRRPDNFSVNKPSLVEIAPELGAPRASFNAPAFLPMPDLKPTRGAGTSREYRGTGMSTVDAPMDTSAKHERWSKKRECDTPGLTGTGGVTMASMDTTALQERWSEKRECDTPGVTGTWSANAVAGMSTTGAHAKGTKRGGVCDVAGVVPGAFRIGGAETRVSGINVAGGRELEARQAGGVSYLKGETVRACVALGRGREAKGRTEAGALQGGVAATRAGRVQRRVPTNAFGKPLAGAAANAQQRASPGNVCAKKKISSEDPRATAAGLGLGLFATATCK